MSTEEIFSGVASRQVEGMMFHDQMANYYRFLGLKGFAREQEYRFLDETKEYQKLCRYYVRHYNRLLPETKLSDPAVIPSSWHNYSRQDVDSSTKRGGASDGFKEWIGWEKATKELYEKAAHELYTGGSVAGAIVVEKMVADVDKELAQAQDEALSVESLDLVGIVEAQEAFLRKYKHD